MDSEPGTRPRRDGEPTARPVRAWDAAPSSLQGPRAQLLWSLIITVPPLLFAVVPFSFQGTLDGRGWTAIGALLAIPAAWWAFGRLAARSGVARWAFLVVFTVAAVVAMVAIPPLAMLQAVYFPVMWMLLDDIRSSVWASVGFGALLSAISMIGAPLAALPSVLVMASMSVALSIGVGLAITYAWKAAEERTRLLEELRAAQAELVEVSRLAGVSAERERMSRELHDTLAQSLVGAGMLVDRAKRSAARIGDGVAAGADAEALAPQLAKHAELLDALGELSRDALGETRALIAESAPVDDGQSSFGAALARLADRFERETGIEVAFGSSLDEARLDRATQVVLLRCAQEGLANVRRHAQAGSARIEVREGAPGERLGEGPAAAGPTAVLELADDGVGFRPEAASSGFGLPGLRERARALGGAIRIDSAPGAGTTVRIQVPIAATTATSATGIAAAAREDGRAAPEGDAAEAEGAAR